MPRDSEDVLRNSSSHIAQQIGPLRKNVETF